MAVIGYCTVTVPAAQVTSGPHAHFPVLIDHNIITDAAFYDALTGAGGATHIHCYDTNTDGTEYDREIVVFTDSPDSLELWVRLPSISNAVDNVICVTVETTSRANDTTTWTTGGYFTVRHYQEASGNSVDSTGNYAGTTSGVTYGATGKIQKGYNFDGSNDNDNLGNITQENSVAACTWSGWVKQDIIDAVDIFVIRYVSASAQFQANTSSDGSLYAYCGAGANSHINDYSAVVIAGIFFHLAIAYDGTQATNLTKLKIYIDGISRADHFAGTIPATTPDMSTVSRYIGYTSNAWDGIIDEVRGNSNTLSAGWLATEYNNQNTPATFASSASYSKIIIGTMSIILPDIPIVDMDGVVVTPSSLSKTDGTKMALGIML